MPQFQKGRAKTGGRKPGTPNKSNPSIKTAIEKLLTDYQESGLFESDFAALEPKDRLIVAEKYLQYTTPKRQAIAVSGEEERPMTIEQTLIKLSK